MLVRGQAHCRHDEHGVSTENEEGGNKVFPSFPFPLHGNQSKPSTLESSKKVHTRCCTTLVCFVPSPLLHSMLDGSTPGLRMLSTSKLDCFELELSLYMKPGVGEAAGSRGVGSNEGGSHGQAGSGVPLGSAARQAHGQAQIPCPL